MNATETQVPLNSPTSEDSSLPSVDKALAEYEALKSEAIELFRLQRTEEIQDQKKNK